MAPRKPKDAESAKPEATDSFAELWPIEKVIAAFADYNPRLIKQDTMDSLRGLIRTVGVILPVVLNKRSGRLVGGHQRVKAAELEGLKEIPVKLVDLDDEEERVLNLALNKIEGKWDYSLLEEALAKVSEGDALALSGFSEADLVEIMSGQEEEFSQTFEEFAERFANKKTQDFVQFRSPQVAFTCAKSTYEALVHRLYSKVGVDDIAASVEFFRLIGLEVNS